MHKVVGIGLIVLLIGYVMWIATRGTAPGQEETVVLNSYGSGGSGGSGAARDLSEEQTLKIVTLLGFDAIPSIQEPRFVEPEIADDTYDPEELVLGVEITGDARAYSVPLLSRHEIVNDVVGGKPIAVTW
jgi:hypothetical protein